MTIDLRIVIRLCLVFVILNIMFTPLIILYVLGVDLASFEFFTLSIYGIYIVLYLIIQILFSLWNSHRTKRIAPVSYTGKKYNILAVGYRENAELFRKCLDSVKILSFNPLVNHIYVIVDGNETGDDYMKEIFKEVFPLGNVVVLDDLPSATGSIKTSVYENINENGKVHCIMQPHKGKRHVLYTGLKLSCIDKELVKGVLCTDSDTVLDNNCVHELAKCIQSDDVGAVTGHLKIYNPYSFISYMTSLRYFLAFNLERGYQSFNGIVLCVSGPLGMYKTELLDTFIDVWVKQQFLGKECTYGDDRHLTNQILNLGKKVLYNPKATCKTDAPEEYLRFFIQQVRWYKSSSREFLYSLRFIHKHSLWIIIDLMYQFVYSFIVIISLFYILYTGTFRQLITYLYTVIIFNMIKGIYATIIEKNIKYLLFSIYGLIYITTLAPAKIYSIIDIKDISWGTTNRLNKHSTLLVNLKYIIWICLWNLLMSGGIAYNVYRNYDSISNSDVISIIIILGFIVLKCTGVIMVHNSKRKKEVNNQIINIELMSNIL